MNAYEQKQEARRERLLARADRLRSLADLHFRKADLREEVSGIPFGQPILVGHHSERRHRRAIERADAAMRRSIEASKAAAEAAGRASSVGTGGISSDDPDAVAKLREQLEEAEAEQAQMIAANKLVRKGDQAGLAALMGSEKIAAALLQPGMIGGMGFAHYQLTNNGANIRRLKERIGHLERNATRETKETLHNSGVRMVENAEANRVQLFFDGKPAAEIRDRLKHGGFRWSPTEGAWQRHLNAGGIWAARQILESLTGKNTP